MLHSLSWQLSSMDLVQDDCNPLGLLSWHQGAFQAPVSWDKLLVTSSTPGCHFHHSHVSHTTSWLSVKIGVGKVREREREREKFVPNDNEQHVMEYSTEDRETERAESPKRKTYLPTHLAIKQLKLETMREREIERLLWIGKQMHSLWPDCPNGYPKQHSFLQHNLLCT